MKLHHILISVFSVFGIVVASAQDINRYDLAVENFQELSVTDGINVEYVWNPDSAGHAVFYAPARTASMIMFKNSPDKLDIQLSTDASGEKDLPVIRVYSAFLTKVRNSGDSTVRVLSIAPVPKASFELIGNGRLIVHDIKSNKVEGALNTGNGSLVLFGKVDEATLKFIGTGIIQADELEAKKVTVKAGGTSQIGCWATEKLSIYGTGSSTIYYKGSPEIKKVSLGLKVKNIDER